MITLRDHPHQSSVAQDRHEEDGHFADPPAPPRRRCCPLRPEACRRGRAAPAFRLLVTGPPRSGLSSLLFQLAYAEAASAAGNSGAVYIRVQDEAAAAADAWLPLDSCCASDLRAEDVTDAAERRQGQQPSSTSASRSWVHGYDPSVLARIQVHHVVSLRDVYKILLSLSSASSVPHPHLIVLDGVDRLLQRRAASAIEDDGNHKHPDPLMAMSQLLSLLVDTANQCGGEARPPVSVAASITRSANTSRSSSAPLVSPALGFDTVRVVPAGGSSDGRSRRIAGRIHSLLQAHFPDTTLESMWRIEHGSDQKTWTVIVKDGLDSYNPGGRRLIMHVDDD